MTQSSSPVHEPFRFGRRFAGMAILVGTIVTMGLTFLQTQVAERSYYRSLEDNGHVILESLVSLCSTNLLEHQPTLLGRQLHFIAGMDRFAYIDVRDPSGNVIISVLHPGRGHGTSRESKIELVKDNILDLSADLDMDGRPLGKLDVGIWGGEVSAVRSSIHRRALETGIALCAALALIFWGIGAWLGIRLRSFARAIINKDEEDYSPVSVEGDDEISALAQAFNQRQLQLKQAHERRNAAERQRHDLTEMIVHDLKGPLAGFGAGLSSFEEAVVESRDADLVSTFGLMQKGIQRLLKMIDSILRIAKLERQLSVKVEKFDLEALLKERVDEAQMPAMAAQQRIALRVESNLPPCEGDSDLLGRVIDNLLFNAIEHSPRGSVVRVHAQRQQDRFVVEVHDQGPGVPENQRALIFDKFQKGQTTTRGVGLGLAFCKLAVERHGGQISVRPGGGGGSVFHFTMPVRASVPQVLVV